MSALLGWLLRAIFVALGVGAAIWLARWAREAGQRPGERWPVRIGLGMLLLAGAYAIGHARLLVKRPELEAARARWAFYGDPRLTEERRAEVRGWILDCSGDPSDALALYRERDGSMVRAYPLEEGGANLIGGGEDAGERDFTVERLFADRLREPRSLAELGEPHPAGKDLQLTLCLNATARAWELLENTGHPGAVIVQDVNTGAVVAYAATGGPQQAPVGIQEYSPPGSVWKLALSALWWEAGLPEMVLTCPSEIRLSERALIENAGRFSLPPVTVPEGMLIPSCNTTAVEMALIMRERLGEEAFVEAFRRFGFVPYTDNAPTGFQTDFWATSSEEWAERMSPPPARIRIGPETNRAEWGQLAIGQGPLDVTPIHISRFMQAIGNDGVMLKPTIEAEQAAEPAGGERIMSETTAERLQAVMLEIVDRGTARSVRPRVEDLAWDLGGKTGTAQVRGEPDNGWFAGLIFGADGDPRYSVTVFLEGGGPGGRQPASIAAELTRLLAARTESRAGESAE
ncbi:MAG TPA: penicillin-binding transpeptidase domain-containing protein [Longimicrobiaceae bacterium]|nr:penicillin-binding transpeptidase domain-containing protein [Longimicrobiaceae bacterium]